MFIVLKGKSKVELWNFVDHGFRYIKESKVNKIPNRTITILEKHVEKQTAN